jgi:phosphopantetheinyl transferase (holo-ACP synthase)
MGTAYHFDEIKIAEDDAGGPGAAVHGKVKIFCHHNHVTGIHASLSHTPAQAKAVVLLERSLRA